MAELIDGFGVWSLQVRNAFKPLDKPLEVQRLPQLQAQVVADVQDYNRNRNRNRNRGQGQRPRALPRLLELT
jgi:hypothetical protein